ncbi:MAG: hypothetical protein FWG83_00310 [Oscillospiraceae bacterium]|nr:hypothetical protein [Oscillospiraceae bacterium]
MRKILVLVISTVITLGVMLYFNAIGAFGSDITPPPGVPDHLQLEGTHWYLQRGVWGNVRDDEVLLIAEEVAGVLYDAYSKEYMLRHNNEEQQLFIKASDNNGAFIYTNLEMLFISSSGTHWSIYVRQLSHELAHYATGGFYISGRHFWFDELICEVHAFYALDVLSEKWKNDAPRPNWAYYGKIMRNEYRARAHYYSIGIYEHELAELFKQHRQTLEESPMVEWDFDAGEVGGNDNVNRFINTLAAPIYESAFKDNPHSWDALKILYAMGDCEELTFEEYINEWYSRCNDDLKPTVKTIADFFEIEII